MTKADIVTEIAHRTGLERVAIQVIVDEFMEAVKDNMAEGENIYLRGFGTFEIVKRAEKTARNISKGTTLIVPAHNVPHFKPSQEFKACLK